MDETPDNPRLVWSDSWPDNVHHWFPCFDYPNDKATSEMIVTVRDPLVAVSNGRLLSTTRDAARGMVTYHWREDKPHVSYCVSIAVGTYVEVKDRWGTLPIVHYVYPHQRADAMREVDGDLRVPVIRDEVPEHPREVRNGQACLGVAHRRAEQDLDIGGHRGERGQACQQYVAVARRAGRSPAVRPMAVAGPHAAKSTWCGANGASRLAQSQGPRSKTGAEACNGSCPVVTASRSSPK